MGIELFLSLTSLYDFNPKKDVGAEAGKMAQQVQSLVAKLDPEFNPWEPQGGRRAV